MSGTQSHPWRSWTAAAAAAVLGGVLLLWPLPTETRTASPQAADRPPAPAPDQQQPQPKGNSTTAAALPSPLPASTAAPGPPPSPTAVVPRGPDVVRGFAENFTRPADDPDAWPARIRRWTTPQFAEQLTSTDPRLLPPAPLRELETVDLGDAVDFLARYDDDVLIAGRAERTTDGWAVVTVEPVIAGAVGLR